MDAIVVNNAIYNLSTALREQDNARLRKGRKLTLVTVQADDLHTVLGSLIAMRNAAPCHQPTPRGGRCDAMRENAARYEWLRMKHNDPASTIAVTDDEMMLEDIYEIEGLDLDAAIARAQGVQS